MYVEGKTWRAKRHNLEVFRCANDEWEVSIPVPRARVGRSFYDEPHELVAQLSVRREDIPALVELLQTVLDETEGEFEPELSDYEKGFADGLLAS